MQTIGAVLIALVLLAIPAFLVLPPLVWAFLKCGSLRTENDLAASRARRGGH